MKINTGSLNFKLISVVFASFIILSTLVTLTAVIQSKNSLTKSTFNQLLAIRETQSTAIENYFNSLSNTIKAIAAQESVVAALEEFTDAFGNYENYYKESAETTGTDLIKQYENEYLNKVNYKIPRSPQRRSTDKYLPETTGGKFLQHTYIYKNTHNVGEKHQMVKSDITSPYNTAHSMYHQSFTQLLTNFQLYDIFLIDTEGNIVYSVFKEKDFATNLKSGVYSGSGLGKLYNKLSPLKQEQIAFEDFFPYEPSYNYPAAFIGRPVSVEGEKIGYIVFQVPIDGVNAITSNNGDFEGLGFGKTGQVVLIGKDKYLRNNHRFIDNIKKKNEVVASTDTTVGMLKVDSKPSARAISGESSYGTFSGNFGNRAFTAFSPITFLGTTWGIVVKKNYDEAISGANKLRNMIIIISVVVTILALAISVFFIRVIVVRKIRNLTKITKNIATGDGDLTQRIPVTSNDEIGELTNYFNQFINLNMR